MGQGLADLLSGAAGAPVNRPQLNAFVANSQAQNGLRSAQTEEALLNAQRAQEEQQASSDIEEGIRQANPNAPPSQVHMIATAMKMHTGSAANAIEMLKASNMLTLGDEKQLNTPAQTAAAQAMKGGLLEPVAAPNTMVVPAGVKPNIQQTPQGLAQTAQTKAMTGLDVARAEDEHAKAKNALTAGMSTLSPAALDEAARVTMADPTKMSTYAVGNSGKRNKDAINNRRAEMLNQANMSTDDMIRQRAITKASVGAAGQAAKQGQVLDAFMPLIKNSSDRIMTLLEQIDSAGSGGVDEPIVNGFERMVGRKLNSDDMTELHSVFTSYQNEIARLLAAGPSMNGVISDHARADMEGMAPETMSVSGARRVLNRIDVETGIRRQGVQHSLEEAANAQMPVISGPQQHNLPAASTGTADSNLPPGFHRLN